MRKYLFAVIVIFILQACVLGAGGVDFDVSKAEYYRMELEEEGRNFYFRYPKGASIKEEMGFGTVFFETCRIQFAPYNSDKISDLLSAGESLEKERNDGEEIDFEAWYMDNSLVAYLAFIDEFEYVFWIEDEDDLSSCIDLLEETADSFTDQPVYFNEKYSYSLNISPDYKLKYLPDGSGIVLENWGEDELENGPEDTVWYQIEIKIHAFGNAFEYEDLSDFIVSEYDGYSTDFYSREGLSGVFVDETESFYAIRHFFTMSDDAKFVYDLSIKVPSVNYAENRDRLEEILESFQLL